MREILTAAHRAREMLAAALGALQGPGVPNAMLEVAEPVAKAMSALHRIEASHGSESAQAAPVALDCVRRALEQLQTASATVPVVDRVIALVAEALGSVHRISQAMQSAKPPVGTLHDQAVPRPLAAPGLQHQARGLEEQAVAPQRHAPAPHHQPASVAAAPPRQVAPTGAAPKHQHARIASTPQRRAAPTNAAPRDADLAQRRAPSAVAPSPRHPGPTPEPLAFSAAPSPERAQSAPKPQAAAAAPSPQTAERGRRNRSRALPPDAASLAHAEAPPQETPPTHPNSDGPSASNDLQGAGPLSAPPMDEPTPDARPVVSRLAEHERLSPAQNQPFNAPGRVAARDSDVRPPEAPAIPAERRDVSLRRIEAELGANSSTNFYKGLSGNDVIESGGIFIATYLAPKLGEELRLHISLPGGYEFDATAVVEWTRTISDSSSYAPPGFGARFRQIPQEGRQLVYRYVRNREPLLHDDL